MQRTAKNSYIGGAGKTTLTFHLATEYALSHEDEDIVVLDMCPQANVSAALLSSVNEKGEGKQGDQVVREMTKTQVKCNDAESVPFPYDKTVCGYLMAKIDKRGTNCEQFLVEPAKYNKYLPENIYLLCGDTFLEVIAKRLEGERLLPPRLGGPWKKVTEFMDMFVKGVVRKHHRRREHTFFIDTNPSFAVYTELAVLAANRLIVPFNADDFSRTAVKSMLYLLYGIEIDNEQQVKYEHLREYEFWYRAKQENLSLPKIHLLINNKITPYREGLAKAFGAKESEISFHIQSVKHAEPTRFVDHSKTLCELNDFHTAAVQCLHLGCPLRKIPPKVIIGEIVTHASKNKDKYIEKLKEIVELL